MAKVPGVCNYLRFGNLKPPEEHPYDNWNNGYVSEIIEP